MAHYQGRGCLKCLCGHASLPQTRSVSGEAPSSSSAPSLCQMFGCLLSAFSIYFLSAESSAKLSLLYTFTVTQLNSLRSAIRIFFWRVTSCFAPLSSSSWTTCSCLAEAGGTVPTFASASFAVLMWLATVWLNRNCFSLPFFLNWNPLSSSSFLTTALVASA